MKIFYLLLASLVLLLTLSSCGESSSATLSKVELTPPNAILTPGDASKTVSLAYDIGQDAHINLYLTGPGTNKNRYDLRQNEARTPGHYAVELNGIVTVTENGLPQQRLLPDGVYNYTLEAHLDSNGQTAPPQTGQFKVVGNSNQPPPLISNLSANPAVISPNFDALDDVTNLNWQVSQPATVTVMVEGANGVNRVLRKPKFEPAQADEVTFDGLDVKQAPLPDGVYTYTVQAADQFGNVSQASSNVTIKGGGEPKAAITSAEFSPQEVIKGGEITVTIKVKNVGSVPIRSLGPDSGYTYDSRSTYRNIEGGQYDYKAGFWRVGVGTGSTQENYPYRWGFGHDLQPGEEVTVVGHIIVNETDSKLTFFVGLLQEQKALRADKIKVTTIKISS